MSVIKLLKCTCFEFVSPSEILRHKFVLIRNQFMRRNNIIKFSVGTSTVWDTTYFKTRASSQYRTWWYVCHYISILLHQSWITRLQRHLTKYTADGSSIHNSVSIMIFQHTYLAALPLNVKKIKVLIYYTSLRLQQLANLIKVLFQSLYLWWWFIWFILFVSALLPSLKDR
jgi:hypothetical protein